MTEDLAARLQTAQQKIAQYLGEIRKLEEDNQLLRRKIENHILISDHLKIDYNRWLDDLDLEGRR